MNKLEATLLKTHKSIHEACIEVDVEFSPDMEIELKQCSSCGIWLKNMRQDRDGLDTCNLCIETYGY